MSGTNHITRNIVSTISKTYMTFGIVVFVFTTCIVISIVDIKMEDTAGVVRLGMPCKLHMIKCTINVCIKLFHYEYSK